MKGSRESLIRQNEKTEADGPNALKDDADLNQMRAVNSWSPCQVNASMRINEGLPVNRRYCRPWTAKFSITWAAHTTAASAARCR